MNKMYLTKIVTFCCSHQLLEKDWSDEKNRDEFGKCSNLHGHNYKLEVTVTGELNQSGMIMNIAALSKIIRTKIVDHIDHKTLNTDIDYFKTHLPTMENMVIYFWDILEPHLPKCTLFKLTLYETDHNKVEYIKN